MTKTVDYFYSHVSPWAFLGHTRFLRIAERTGAVVAFHPITVAEIFPKTGGVPLAKRPSERRAYRMVELKRWSKHLGVSMNFEPKHFPVDDRPSQRMALAAQEAGADLGSLSYAFLKSVWQDELDISDWLVLCAIADDLGLDGAGLADRAQSDEIGAAAVSESELALSRGCFGVPWYAIGNDGYWGQDRLDLLEVSLNAD